MDKCAASVEVAFIIQFVFAPGMSNPPPQCHMCNMKGGMLLRVCAKPGSKKRWKGKKAEYEQFLFGKISFATSYV